MMVVVSNGTHIKEILDIHLPTTYRSQRVVHHYILAKIQKQLNQLSSMQIKEFVWYGIMISHIAYLLVIIKVDVYCQVI